ncbi:MAG: SRPBCC domain-containing protein [Planctomycetota bacterium]
MELDTEITQPDDTSLAVSCSLPAPIERVWAATVEAAWLERWMTGPAGWSLVVERNEPRTGGALRFVWSGADGTSMAMSGRYIAFDPPTHVAHTELYDQDWHDGEARVTTDLSSIAGGTRATLTIRYSSQACRDRVFGNVAPAVAEGYARLAALLSTGR